MCIWGIASWIPPIQLTYLASWIWKWYEVVNNPYIAIYITEVHPSNGLFSMWLISHFYQSGLLNILNMWLMHDWQHHFFLGYPHFKKRVQRATSGSWDRHDIMTSHVARLDWRFEKLATPRNSSPAPWCFIWWPAWFFQMWETHMEIQWFAYWKMIYQQDLESWFTRGIISKWSNIFPHLSVCLQEGTQETQGNLVEWWRDGRYG